MLIYVTHVSAMPLLPPQRRNAAPIPPDRPDVSGGRTGAAEDHRQPGSPGRTDRLRHSGEDLRCPLPIRGEAGVAVQSRRTDGNLCAFVRSRPGFCRFVGEDGTSGGDHGIHSPRDSAPRSLPGDLPDGPGTAAESFEQALHQSVGANDLGGTTTRR
jgi:hypothetical protein